MKILFIKNSDINIQKSVFGKNKCFFDSMLGKKNTGISEMFGRKKDLSTKTIKPSQEHVEDVINSFEFKQRERISKLKSERESIQGQLQEMYHSDVIDKDLFSEKELELKKIELELDKMEQEYSVILDFGADIIDKKNSELKSKRENLSEAFHDVNEGLMDLTDEEIGNLESEINSMSGRYEQISTPWTKITMGIFTSKEARSMIKNFMYSDDFLQLNKDEQVKAIADIITKKAESNDSGIKKTRKKIQPITSASILASKSADQMAIEILEFKAKKDIKKEEMDKVSEADIHSEEIIIDGLHADRLINQTKANILKLNRSIVSTYGSIGKILGESFSVNAFSDTRMVIKGSEEIILKTVSKRRSSIEKLLEKNPGLDIDLDSLDNVDYLQSKLNDLNQENKNNQLKEIWSRLRGEEGAVLRKALADLIQSAKNKEDLSRLKVEFEEQKKSLDKLDELKKSGKFSKKIKEEFDAESKKIEGLARGFRDAVKSGDRNKIIDVLSTHESITKDLRQDFEEAQENGDFISMNKINLRLKSISLRESVSRLEFKKFPNGLIRFFEENQLANRLITTPAAIALGALGAPWAASLVVASLAGMKKLNKHKEFKSKTEEEIQSLDEENKSDAISEILIRMSRGEVVEESENEMVLEFLKKQEDKEKEKARMGLIRDSIKAKNKENSQYIAGNFAKTAAFSLAASSIGRTVGGIIRTSEILPGILGQTPIVKEIYEFERPINQKISEAQGIIMGVFGGNAVLAGSNVDAAPIYVAANSQSSQSNGSSLESLYGKRFSTASSVQTEMNMKPLKNDAPAAFDNLVKDEKGNIGTDSLYRETAKKIITIIPGSEIAEPGKAPKNLAITHVLAVDKEWNAKYNELIAKNPSEGELIEFINKAKLDNRFNSLVENAENHPGWFGIKSVEEISQPMQTKIESASIAQEEAGLNSEEQSGLRRMKGDVGEFVLPGNESTQVEAEVAISSQDETTLNTAESKVPESIMEVALDESGAVDKVKFKELISANIGKIFTNPDEINAITNIFFGNSSKQGLINDHNIEQYINVDSSGKKYINFTEVVKILNEQSNIDQIKLEITNNKYLSTFDKEYFSKDHLSLPTLSEENKSLMNKDLLEVVSTSKSYDESRIRLMSIFSKYYGSKDIISSSDFNNLSAVFNSVKQTTEYFDSTDNLSKLTNLFGVNKILDLYESKGSFDDLYKATFNGGSLPDKANDPQGFEAYMDLKRSYNKLIGVYTPEMSKTLSSFDSTRRLFIEKTNYTTSKNDNIFSSITLPQTNFNVSFGDLYSGSDIVSAGSLNELRLNIDNKLVSLQEELKTNYYNVLENQDNEALKAVDSISEKYKSLLSEKVKIDEFLKDQNNFTAIYPQELVRSPKGVDGINGLIKKLEIKDIPEFDIRNQNCSSFIENCEQGINKISLRLEDLKKENGTGGWLFGMGKIDNSQKIKDAEELLKLLYGNKLTLESALSDKINTLLNGGTISNAA